MYGNAERSPVNWIAWSFGLFLIALILIVSGYMFVMYLKSQHKKNQIAEEQKRIEEERAYLAQLAANNQATITSANTESIRDIGQNSEKNQTSETSKKDNYSVRSSDETIGEKPVILKKAQNVCLNNSPSSVKTATKGSKEASTEELSSKKSLTDLKSDMKTTTKSEKKVIGGEISVEMNTKLQIPTTEKRVSSAEKAPGSSIGSDMSTYIISSQRSEMNNYNMIEAGRTPPTFSNSEVQLHQTSSIESILSNTAVQSSADTPPTVIPAVKQNSETIVSITTPPIKK